MACALALALLVAGGACPAGQAAPSAGDRCPEPPALALDEDPFSEAWMRKALVGAPGLLIALGNDRNATLAAWLESGVDPNVCFMGGSLVAFSTVGKHDLAQTEVLLAHGADPNHPRNWDGGSALLTALGFDRLDAARLLLDYGADPRATRDDGATALTELAASAQHDEDAARAATRVALAQRLLDAGVPVDGLAFGRVSALMWAGLGGRADLVRLLLAHGADPTRRGSKGDPIEVMVRRKGYGDVADLLARAARERMEPAPAAASAASTAAR